MKNPIEPNIKTELFTLFIILVSFLTAFYFQTNAVGGLMVAFSRDGRLGQEIPWSLVILSWPVILVIIYLMFLSFPYFKINKTESASLKESWHRAKEVSLSGLFILQVVAMFNLFNYGKSFFLVALIVFLLLIISLIPTLIKIFKYRRQQFFKF